jgi:hypothetical protein
VTRGYWLLHGADIVIGAARLGIAVERRAAVPRRIG